MCMQCNYPFVPVIVCIVGSAASYGTCLWPSLFQVHGRRCTTPGPLSSLKTSRSVGVNMSSIQVRVYVRLSAHSCTHGRADYPVPNYSGPLFLFLSGLHLAVSQPISFVLRTGRERERERERERDWEIGRNWIWFVWTFVVKGWIQIEMTLLNHLVISSILILFLIFIIDLMVYIFKPNECMYIV